MQAFVGYILQRCSQETPNHRMLLREVPAARSQQVLASPEWRHSLTTCRTGAIQVDSIVEGHSRSSHMHLTMPRCVAPISSTAGINGRAPVSGASHSEMESQEPIGKVAWGKCAKRYCFPGSR